MPNYRETRTFAKEIRRRIRQDQNNPYIVRRRKDGIKDSRGGVVGQQYETRMMSNVLTQPLSRTEFNRLPEGWKIRKPRFVAVIPETGKLFQTANEMLDEGEQIKYMDEWYEVKGINNWDQILHAHMVTVE